MSARPGRLLQLFFRLVFDVRGLGKSADRLRDEASKGVVVYVLSHRRLFDVLYLNAALLFYRLPVAWFVNSLRLWWLQPLRAMWARLMGRWVQDEPDRLEACVRSGRASLLCLRAAPAEVSVRSGVLGHHLLARLERLSKTLDRPVVFVPLMVMWGRHPIRPSMKTSFMGRLFGPPETPGGIRSLVQFFLYMRRLSVVPGQPIILSEFLAEHEQDRPNLKVARLRWTLQGGLETQRRVTWGPRRKGAAQLRAEILRDRHVREAIDRLADDEGRFVAELRRQADAYLKEIAADFNPYLLRFMRSFMSFVFNRMYSEVDIPDAAVDLMKQTGAKGPLIVLPSHKSHVDYLLISWAMGWKGVAPPLIAAGINLSFWPVGTFFRGSGAFFLRRSFRSNRLYAMIFSEYLTKVLAEGYNLEFFIEGGRSRTGKVLSPKMGMIRWIARATLENRIPECYLLPVDISYEKVVETRAYARELAGGKKRSEDATDLLRAGKVLGGRFGKLSMHPAEPFGLKQALTEAGIEPGCDDAAFNAAVARVAHRIVHDISRAVHVTPTALVASSLLASGKRFVTREYVLAAGLLYGQRVLAGGGILAKGLDEAVQSGTKWSDYADYATDFLVSDGLVERHQGSRDLYYHVKDEARTELAYYRNTLINLVVSEAVVARAVFALERVHGRGSAILVKDLRRRALDLSRLLKKEFVFRVGATFDVIFSDTLAEMVPWGLELEEQSPEMTLVRVSESGRRHLELLSTAIADFCQGYTSATRSLSMLLDGPMTRRHLESKMQDRCLAEFYRGEVTRRESCVRTMFRNAVGLWLETDVLVSAPSRGRSGQVVALSPVFADRSLLEEARKHNSFFAW